MKLINNLQCGLSLLNTKCYLSIRNTVRKKKKAIIMQFYTIQLLLYVRIYKLLIAEEHYFTVSLWSVLVNGVNMVNLHCLGKEKSGLLCFQWY